MMEFCRPASKEDFEEYDLKVERNYILPEEVKELIEDGDIIRGIKVLREQTGMMLREANEYCRAYEAYLKAKSDFEQGVQVYIKY